MGNSIWQNTDTANYRVSAQGTLFGMGHKRALKHKPEEGNWGLNDGTRIKEISVILKKMRSHGRYKSTLNRSR